MEPGQYKNIISKALVTVLKMTFKGVELRFPKGRFKFGRWTTSPKFATIIAIFRPV